MRSARLACLLLSASSFLCAQNPSQPEAKGVEAEPPSSVRLAEIASRGHLIAEYDQAAWHSSDAVMALKPGEGEFTGYVAQKKQDGRWLVAFGHFDATRSAYLVVYEAQQGATAKEFAVTKHNPPRADKDYFFQAATAYETAESAFRKTNATRRYNLTVLPAPNGDWYAYAIPAQTDFAVLPFGGDIRYHVSADGNTLVDTRQMHHDVLEEAMSGVPDFGFHTHFLSDEPEDSDIFYALTRNAKLVNCWLRRILATRYNPGEPTSTWLPPAT